MLHSVLFCLLRTQKIFVNLNFLFKVCKSELCQLNSKLNVIQFKNNYKGFKNEILVSVR